MHKRIAIIPALLTLGAVACTPDAGPAGSADSFTTDMERESYALGFDFGESVRDGAEFIDLDAYALGFEDGLENTSAIPWEERTVALELIARKIRRGIDEAAAAAASEASARGQATLAENAARDGVTVTESGVQYEVIEEGDGPTADPDDQVRLHYRGTLTDGTEFDSSYDGDPAVFSPGQLIPGFAEALQMIPMGSTWRVWIPADLAYGQAGAGQMIGPNEVLIFEIEAIEIVDGG